MKQKKKNKNSLERTCMAFETRYGTGVFTKVCLSALQKLLVNKKLVTEEELVDYLTQELK